MFDDESSIVRIDMSEYQEKHTVSRLVGAPPGPWATKRVANLPRPCAGSLTRSCYSMRSRRPSGRVQPAAQMLDDGRLTDSQAARSTSKNTIVTMTSNIGSQYLLDGINSDGQITEIARAQVNKALQAGFKPEFLNRMDEIVMFKPLTQPEICRIARLMLDKTCQRMKDQGYTLTVEDTR